jgi:transposase-like protein
MTEWLNRPLEKVYPVIFIDARLVKVRDGQVASKPVYVVIGVTVDGERGILGLWAGDGGEGAKVLAWRVHRDQEPRRSGRLHRGLRRPEGSPGGDHDDVGARDSQSLCASDPQHIPVRLSQVLGDEMSRDLRPVYTAPSEAVARERFAEFDAKWPKQYQAISKLWENAWS